MKQKPLELPKVPDNRGVVINFDDHVVSIGYDWTLDTVNPEEMSSEEISGDKMVANKIREFTPTFQIFKRVTGTTKHSGQRVIKVGRVEYEDVNIQLDNLDDLAVWDTLTKDIIASVHNHLQVRTAVSRMFKISVLSENNIGESVYGQTRFDNVDRFNFEELKELLAFQSTYQENEFDVDGFNTAIDSLIAVAPVASKPKFGTYRDVVTVKFKESV